MSQTERFVKSFFECVSKYAKHLIKMSAKRHKFALQLSCKDKSKHASARCAAEYYVNTQSIEFLAIYRGYNLFTKY